MIPQRSVVGASQERHYNPRMRTAWRCLFLSFLCSWAAASTVSATQWIVAQDGSGAFRSIQGAIDAASYGDVVYISAGVYDEHVGLKDGVRVVGAGQASTVIRHAYGFDEVVRIAGMSSGSLEKVTIERQASVLPGPVVSAESAGASLVDCTILGGQDAGIDAVGAACTLTLERVSITGNAGHGVYVHDGASVALVDSDVEENGGSGLVTGARSAVDVSGTTLADNGRCGIAVEGDGRVRVENSALRRHPEWGLVALGAASVDLRNVQLSDNAAGGLDLGGTCSATLDGILLSGGAVGISVTGSARLTAVDVRIHDAVGNGLQLGDASTLVGLRFEVASASQNGVLFATSGDASLAQSTVVDCGADGVLVLSGRPHVDRTIVAYNHGDGIRLDASGSSSPIANLAYNAVWANGTDYAGTTRPATDIAASPELVDLAGHLALLPDSPCIGAGPAWSSIGAGVDAGSRSSLAFALTPQIDGWLGATWSSTLRLGGLPVELQTVDLAGVWTGDGGRLELDASLVGEWGMRASVHGEGTAWRSGSLKSGNLVAVEFGGDGELSAPWSWASAWLNGEAEGAGLYADARVSLAWPKGPWTADLSFGLSGPVPLRLSAGMTDLTLRSLAASLSARLPVAGGELKLDAKASLLPVLEAVAEGTWTRGTQEWRARLDARPTEDAIQLLVSIGDAAASVEARTRLLSGVPTDGDLSLTLGGSALRLRTGLSLDSSGPRFRAGVEVTLNSLFPKVPNEPPVPALESAPPDPEVRTAIRFSADGSTDPDGEIREFLWDFGDGSAAEGRSVDHAYTTDGTYTVVLTVADDDGVTSSLSRTLRVWPGNTAPKATFVAYAVTASGVRLPRPLRDGDLVRLDATESSDLDGTVVEYAWDVGADGTFDVTSSEATATVGQLNAGSHPVTLRVIDDSGRSDAVMQVIVVDKSEPPQAQFTFAPPTPAVRDPVYFTDRSVDTDGEIATHEWDFGDGTESREASPIHRYDQAGQYTVTLRVTDDAGLTSTAKQTITVSTVPEIVGVNDVWAVLIGISNYEEVKDLQYASDDAVAMARWLLDSGVAPDHIRLLLDREGPEEELGGLVARRATLVNVREALGWLRRVAKPDDLVVIHFSGHGFQGPDDNGDEKDGVDEFFVLWDTLNADKEDTALRDDEFGAALDRVESQHVVIFFDACYSGGLSRSLPSSARPAPGKEDLFSDFSVEGRLVFSAASESQESFESDELRHGIFTYYLLQGLRGSADVNGDGRVTAWELYEYVASAVPARAKLEHNATQTPQLLGEGDVRVLLAQAAQPPEVDFSYEPATPYAGGEVHFADQSKGDRRIAKENWALGDGTASENAAPVHVYSAPGDYMVELRVTQDNGVESAARHVVHVEPAGRVLSADASSGAIVLSLGSDHGVAVGDHFEISTGHASGIAPTELDVVEVIDGRTSAARVIQGESPVAGAEVRPLSSG